MDSSNPRTQILPTPPRHHEARLDNHIPPLLLPRKAVNTLHQVLITRPIPGNKLPNKRYSTKTPPLINRIENRILHLRELETREYTSWLEHTVRFAQRGALISEVPDSKSDGVQVDAVLCHAGGGEVLGVRQEEVQGGGVGPRGGEGALLAFAEHGGVYVADGAGGVGRVVDRVRVVQEAEGDVAGAAGYVEDFVAWGWGGGGAGRVAGVEGADEVVFPEAVDAEGHQVVHAVVGGGSVGVSCG
jgi:hypothetical protein